MPHRSRPTRKQPNGIRHVAKVIAALGKQDVVALVDLSEVPFIRKPKTFDRSREDLQSSLNRGLDGKPKFDGAHEVKKIQTLTSAKVRLEESELADYKEVMTDDDFIVHVEVQYPDRKLQVRLLLKIKDGKPRLVGWGKEE